MAEIIVKIKRKPQRIEDSSARRRRGTRPSSAPDDYLPRRRRKSGLINFYDLGQILVEGVWRDLDFAVEAGFSSLAAIVDLSQIESNIARPSQTAITALDAKIFEVPFENWTTTYRKLDYGDAYKYNALLKINDKPQISRLDNSNQEWTADGLKTSSVNRLAFLKSFASSLNYTFLPFDTGDTEKIKITESYDYAAPAATFAAGPQMDVFLLPQLVFQAIYLAQASNVDYALYLNFRSLPRERLLDNLQLSQNLPLRLDETIATINDWADYYKTLDLARTLKIPVGGGSAQIAVAADFPVVSAFDIRNFRFLPAFYYPPSHRLNQFFAGKLLAIIRTQSKNFYVWSKTENVQFG